MASILEKALNELLREFSLTVQLEALFDKSEFWGLVETHKTKIQAVKFELVTPNMANISGKLEVDLRGLSQATNSQRTDLEFNSDGDGSLELNPSDTTLESLVEYAAEGGGDISLKVRGLKKRLRTSKTNRTVQVDELELEGNAEIVAATLKELLK